MNPPINSASVKVMRSHDYCHFEIVLGCGHDANGNPIPLTNGMVDDLRKCAARLADKAVEQYCVAKSAKERRDSIQQKWRLEQAIKTPEENRTPEEKAIVKYSQDANFAARFDYDYEDDYEDTEDL